MAWLGPFGGGGPGWIWPGEAWPGGAGGGPSAVLAAAARAASCCSSNARRSSLLTNTGTCKPSGVSIMKMDSALGVLAGWQMAKPPSMTTGQLIGGWSGGPLTGVGDRAASAAALSALSTAASVAEPC